MNNKFKKYLFKQNFNPDILGLFINPFFFARRGLFQNIKKNSSEISGKVLDVGCGRKPYRDLFTVDSYTGIDIENPGHDHSQEEIDIFYDGETFPFDAEVFDAAICSEVLEHVFKPDNFLNEINRVLKSSGTLLITVPFVWDEHEQPNDYARYSSFGLKYLLEKHGFRIINHTKSTNDLQVIFQLSILYLYKKIYTKNRIINAILTILVISPFTIVGLLMSKILPIGSDLFLNNVVLARKT